MIEKSLGFIGGGRVARIILGGLKRAGSFPENIVVSDINEEVLERLKVSFSGIKVTKSNKEAASMDVVFLALHPPALMEALDDLRGAVRSEAIVVSLAPKITIKKLSSTLGGHSKIVRIIPNASSYVNKGYNPIAFSEGILEEDKEWIKKFMQKLGECPEVSEEMLEAYAVLTAMGPTYFEFQLYELYKIAVSFGLREQEAEEGIEKMLAGTVELMFRSGLDPEEVMDLIPVKPLKEVEEQIRNAYRDKLGSLYRKMKS